MRRAALLVLLLLDLSAYAQDIPLYNNYFANPFFYNPSFAGAKKRSELSLLYRQQWTGLQGAPKFSNLTFTAPIGKLGFGINLQNQTRGIITNSSAQLALSYKIELSEKTSFSFGLAAGVGRNSLDMSQVDPNDPSIARILSNSYFLEGQAGVNFQYKSLTLGFALPQFFDKSLVDVQSLQTIKVNPFHSSISSIRVKFPSSSQVQIEPILICKSVGSDLRWEAYGLIHVNQKVWLGGLWRQNYGSAALVGFQISDLLQLGYAYEFPLTNAPNFSFNTHEFRVTFFVGKERTVEQKSNKPKPLPASLRMR